MEYLVSVLRRSLIAIAILATQVKDRTIVSAEPARREAAITSRGTGHLFLDYEASDLHHISSSHPFEWRGRSSTSATRIWWSRDARVFRFARRVSHPGTSRRNDARSLASAPQSSDCNFGVNPKYVSFLSSGNLKIVGCDAEGEVRVVEMPDHRFFVGTLYVPQIRSTPDVPHPLVTALSRAILSS